VGIVAGIAFEAERDVRLRAVDAGHLFGIHLTKLAVRRGVFLRTFIYAFIEAFAPTLDRATVEAALGGGDVDDDDEGTPRTSGTSRTSFDPPDHALPDSHDRRTVLQPA
jgi:LysR family cys regulon transcriptional activator